MAIVTSRLTSFLVLGPVWVTAILISSCGGGGGTTPGNSASQIQGDPASEIQNSVDSVVSTSIIQQSDSAVSLNGQIIVNDDGKGVIFFTEQLDGPQPLIRRSITDYDLDSGFSTISPLEVDPSSAVLSIGNIMYADGNADGDLFVQTTNYTGIRTFPNTWREIQSLPERFRYRMTSGGYLYGSPKSLSAFGQRDLVTVDSTLTLVEIPEIPGTGDFSGIFGFSDKLTVLLRDQVEVRDPSNPNSIVGRTWYYTLSAYDYQFSTNTWTLSQELARTTSTSDRDANLLRADSIKAAFSENGNVVLSWLEARSTSPSDVMHRVARRMNGLWRFDDDILPHTRETQMAIDNDGNTIITLDEERQIRTYYASSQAGFRQRNTVQMLKQDCFVASGDYLKLRMISSGEAMISHGNKCNNSAVGIRKWDNSVFEWTTEMYFIDTPFDDNGRYIISPLPNGQIMGVFDHGQQKAFSAITF